MWALIIPLVQAVSRHTLRGWGAILNLPPFYISVQQIQISHPRSVYSRVLTKLSLTAPPPYCSPHPDLHPGSVAQLKSAAQHLQHGFSLPLVHLGSAPSKPDHSPAHSLRLHCALDQPPCQRSNRERGAGHSTANLGEKKNVCRRDAEVRFAERLLVTSQRHDYISQSSVFSLLTAEEGGKERAVSALERAPIGRQL